MVYRARNIVRNGNPCHGEVPCACLTAACLVHWLMLRAYKKPCPIHLLSTAFFAHLLLWAVQLLRLLLMFSPVAFLWFLLTGGCAVLLLLGLCADTSFGWLPRGPVGRGPCGARGCCGLVPAYLVHPGVHPRTFGSPAALSRSPGCVSG